MIEMMIQALILLAISGSRCLLKSVLIGICLGRSTIMTSLFAGRKIKIVERFDIIYWRGSKRGFGGNKTMIWKMKHGLPLF